MEKEIIKHKLDLKKSRYISLCRENKKGTILTTKILDVTCNECLNLWRTKNGKFKK